MCQQQDRVRPVFWPVKITKQNLSKHKELENINILKQCFTVALQIFNSTKFASVKKHKGPHGSQLHLILDKIIAESFQKVFFPPPFQNVAASLFLEINDFMS